MATLTYRDAVGRALQDSLREDPRLILIGQNIAGYTLKQMAEEFGESRIRDTSISESAMVGMAVGAAMKGWKGVVMIAWRIFLLSLTWPSCRAPLKCTTLLAGVCNVPS